MGWHSWCIPTGHPSRARGPPYPRRRRRRRPPGGPHRRPDPRRAHRRRRLRRHGGPGLAGPPALRSRPQRSPDAPCGRAVPLRDAPQSASLPGPLRHQAAPGDLHDWQRRRARRLPPRHHRSHPREAVPAAGRTADGERAAQRERVGPRGPAAGFRPMRLGPKIFLVSALAIVALSGSAGWSLLTVKRLVSVNQDIATRSVPALRLQGALRETLHGLVRLETRALVLADRDYARAWTERAARMTDDLREVAGYLETPDERAAHAAVRAAFDEYRAYVEEERRLVREARASAALRLAEGPARDATQRAETALAAMTAATEAALVHSQARARELETWTWHAVAVAMLTSLALALAASAWLGLRMPRSLRRLPAATSALASGTWTGPLAMPDRDEIGELSRSFDVMAERLRQVDHLQEEFFSHVSHDLRNPLAAIRLAAETLQERARHTVDARGLRLAQLIDGSATRMLGMVNQILDFTRLRALSLPIETRPVDALGAVTRAMDELRPV